ncbi:hypothetical protein, partial [Rhodoblastus acidophilus]|uniref:hypothetical protein n=1 Tax=Rhodoblastus acidophilus TaxID=1074 RepID=UPI001AECC0C4
LMQINMLEGVVELRGASVVVHGAPADRVMVSPRSRSSAPRSTGQQWDREGDVACDHALGHLVSAASGGFFKFGL